MTSRSRFTGPRRKIVLAFDVGTTNSGISYSILDPGCVPEIKTVTKYPAHELISGASKIPTVIYYDMNGKVQAVGAEAMREGIQDLAEDGNWVKAEWFKLHLRPKLAATRSSDYIRPLPPNKTVVQVLADFLAYLFQCASTYIQDTHANGVVLWASVRNDIDFVLSHPNGWEGPQQSDMRKAAVLAELIPNTPAGNARISFVTEGEASLHFAIHNGLPTGVMQNGDGVIIVDAGGGTIDISAYSRNLLAPNPNTFEEIAVAQCHFNGSIFVNDNARSFLHTFLDGSAFVDDIDHIVACFDKTTKIRFRDAAEPQFIKFGSIRDNDASCNIRSGQLKLLGSDVAFFFKPSIDCIVSAVLGQKRSVHKPITHIILVGGFSASDYILQQVRKMLAPAGLTIVRPESHVNKAVSDGALSFYLDHFVDTRVSKLTYGHFATIQYNPTLSSHIARASQIYYCPVMEEMRIEVFQVNLPKGTQVSETQEFRKSYQKVYSIPPVHLTLNEAVWCYRGQLVNPSFKDLDSENFVNICTIQANISNPPIVRSTGFSGKLYYALRFDIILKFGLTELTAHVEWKDKNNMVQR